MPFPEEAAKISGELIHPLNRTGDEQGVLHHNQVITLMATKPFMNSIRRAAWIGLCSDPEFGGMGMPKMLGILVDEMAYSACNAFTLMAR